MRCLRGMMQGWLRRAVLAAVGLALFATAASAHAVLIDAEPADGGVYSAVPDEARLRFNEPVTPVIIRLLAPDGSNRALDAHSIDNDVISEMPKSIATGTYTLSYRVISLDSHPIGGSLVFAVGTDASASAPRRAASIPRWESLFPYLHGLALVALFFAVGGALFKAFLLPEQAMARRRASVYMPWAAMVGAVAMVLSVGLRGAGLADSPPIEFFTATPWRIALTTSLGTGLALTLAAAACVAAARYGDGRRERLLAVAAVTMLAFGFAVTSHAALAPPVAVAFPVYLIHVAVVAFWLGSLPLLAAALSREPLGVARSIVAAFARVAVWAVGALVIAGVVLAIVQTGPDLSVWLGPVWSAGRYAPTLAAKLVAAAVVLGLALRNNRALTVSLALKGGTDRLRRSIAWEGAFMIAAIGFAAILASLEPPRSTAALASAHAGHSPAGESGVVVDATRNGVEVLLEVDPAAPGANEIIVHFVDAAKGERLAPTEVTVAASLPAGGIEPLRRPALARGDGTYRVEGMVFPVAGTWEIRVEALLTDFDKLIVTMELPVGVPQ